MGKRKPSHFLSKDRKDGIKLTFPQVTAILSAFAGGIGLFVLHNFEQLNENIRNNDNKQNEYIRHFHNNCKETHNGYDEIKEIKNKLSKLESQLSLFPQVSCSK